MFTENRATPSSGLWALWATRSVVQGLGAGAGRPQGGSVHSPSVTGRLSLSLHPFTEAIRFTDEIQDVRLVREPVQQGRRQTLISKDFIMPLSWIA